MKRIVSLVLCMFIPESGLAQAMHASAQIQGLAPVGSFRHRGLPAYAADGSQRREGYDHGLGLSCTMSRASNNAFATTVDIDLSAHYGTHSDPGGRRGGLEQSMLGFAAGVRAYPVGGALRNDRPYLFAAAEAGGEYFERKEGEMGDRDYRWEPTLRLRTGFKTGLGLSWMGQRNRRYFVEAAYHRSLSHRANAPGSQPPTDYLSVGFGMTGSWQ